jgi:hypothetical protein
MGVLDDCIDRCDVLTDQVDEGSPQELMAELVCQRAAIVGGCLGNTV